MEKKWLASSSIILLLVLVVFAVGYSSGNSNEVTGYGFFDRFSFGRPSARVLTPEVSMVQKAESPAMVKAECMDIQLLVPLDSYPQSNEDAWRVEVSRNDVCQLNTGCRFVGLTDITANYAEYDTNLAYDLRDDRCLDTLDENACPQILLYPFEGIIYDDARRDLCESVGCNFIDGGDFSSSGDGCTRNVVSECAYCDATVTSINVGAGTASIEVDSPLNMPLGGDSHVMSTGETRSWAGCSLTLIALEEDSALVEVNGVTESVNRNNEERVTTCDPSVSESVSEKRFSILSFFSKR
jgi:hypothetical protein